MTRLMLLLLLGCAVVVGAESRPKIALIIDDVGYNFNRDMMMADLGVPVTFSILPDYNSSKRIAEMVHDKGLEVMLHLSMESVSGANMGEIGLAKDMSMDEKAHMLNLALAQVPHAVGVNNHMGSLLTADAASMHWLMSELQKRQLYFIDSLTTLSSVAGTVAQAQGLPWLERQVFLDNSLDPKNMDYEFQRALAIAHKKGFAIVIAHPHPETWAFLSRRLALANAYDGVDFVSVSRILPNSTFYTAKR